MENKIYKAFSITPGRLDRNTQSSSRAHARGRRDPGKTREILDCDVACAPRNASPGKTNYLNSIILSIALPLCLSGCMGIYEGGFECPPGKGVGCKSISDVNQMVEQGDLPERSLDDLYKYRCKQCGSHQNQEIDPKNHEKPKIWYSPLNLEEV